MSYDLSRTNHVVGPLDQRGDRSVSRQIAGLDRSMRLAVAQIETKAQVEATKVHAVSYVGHQALVAVALLSEAEGVLSQITPQATSRLQGIADITSIAIAQVVLGSARRLS